MEIHFIYYKSNSDLCNMLIRKSVPNEFLETTQNDADAEIYTRKFSEPSIHKKNLYFVFFSQASMLSDIFTDRIHILYSEQEKTRSFSIQPVRVDDTNLPLYIIRSNIISACAKDIQKVISQNSNGDGTHLSVTRSIVTENLKPNQDAAMEELQKSYARGEIVLYCGAGTSFGNHVPTWKQLLYNIFVDIYNTATTADIDINTFYEAIDWQCGVSLPILARY